jgi:hypothetical protein
MRGEKRKNFGTAGGSDGNDSSGLVALVGRLAREGLQDQSAVTLRLTCRLVKSLIRLNLRCFSPRKRFREEQKRSPYTKFSARNYSAVAVTLPWPDPQEDPDGVPEVFKPPSCAPRR